jgi:hypothetical protein
MKGREKRRRKEKLYGERSKRETTYDQILDGRGR